MQFHQKKIQITRPMESPCLQQLVVKCVDLELIRNALDQVRSCVFPDIRPDIRLRGRPTTSARGLDRREMVDSSRK